MKESIAQCPVDVNVRPRPRLLPNEDRRWGLPDGWVGHVDQDRGLRSMCDHGAARFREGYCDVVNFDCMPAEVEWIKGYMAESHPGVAYSIGSARRALAVAVAEWEAVHGPNTEVSGPSTRPPG